MIFGAYHVELDTVDRYLMPNLETHVGYDNLIELYLGIEVCLHEAIDAEFKRLGDSQEYGLTLEESLAVYRPENGESTYLAGKLMALNSVIVRFMDQTALD